MNGTSSPDTASNSTPPISHPPPNPNAANGPNPNFRAAKPPPTGPAPPAPTTLPPIPPSNGNHTHTHGPGVHHQHAHSHPHTHPHSGRVNGMQKGKKRNDTPVDPATMYESLKSRIAALEEEEVLEEEEERIFAEEAQTSVKGMEDNAIHAKYIELFAELKRVERDHAKEKQKLVKDKDAAKGQLTKANQTKTKMESLARELQKDNKRLREDSKRLAQCVEDAQDEILQLKADMTKRADKVKVQDVKYREMPDIVVKVVCRYRAELFFKISRKTKLSRLFNAWTERMETGTEGSSAKSQNVGGQANGSAKADAASTGSASSGPPSALSMQFVFTHNGRSVDADQTPEEAAMEDGDEILAVELMDLTEEGPASEEWNDVLEPRRQKLSKNWTDNPKEAKRAMEEIFDGVVRERLKEVLRQYELRERHFECVIRSKELEVLLSRARAAEQKQLAEGEKTRSDKADEGNLQLRKDLEDIQTSQTLLIDKLITCCKEQPNAERTQRLFASLREELEKRGSKLADEPVGG
ncbi:hypothetical protein FIBSPDRAFT_734260 [Athelia psychrophila]|uniref:Ubiquitin-like domain-containing protein n=1 Tax=Athelia psychrophila TaxID=1759441 RepID=A0A166NQT9_9AGAM|nr:hypothetical protein FIBSPDRAFT_734260 [Fibularhizoctonia sp. CBS 109695]